MCLCTGVKVDEFNCFRVDAVVSPLFRHHCKLITHEIYKFNAQAHLRSECGKNEVKRRLELIVNWLEVCHAPDSPCWNSIESNTVIGCYLNYTRAVQPRFRRLLTGSNNFSFRKDCPEAARCTMYVNFFFIGIVDEIILFRCCSSPNFFVQWQRHRNHCWLSPILMTYTIYEISSGLRSSGPHVSSCRKHTSFSKANLWTI